MSHEIRTPLNCIVVCQLVARLQSQSDQAESMEMIVSSSDLLLTVVNDVLNYSKLESGNVDIEIRQCSLEDPQLCRSCHRGKGRIKTLCTIYDARICDLINTDGRRLQQILYNLLKCDQVLRRRWCRAAHITLCTFLCIDDNNSYSPSQEKIAAYTKVDEERSTRFTNQGLRPGSK
jgi:nitrogen-specific signal transduction histidine kinase